MCVHVNTNFIQAPFSFRTLRRTKKRPMLLKSIKSLITLVLLYEESHCRLDCVLGWDSMFCVNQA